jgi:iron complex outermembrane receptor protein
VPYISFGGLLTGGDAKGNQQLGASPFTGSMTAEYRIDSGFGEITPSVTVSYNDGYFFYPDNRLKQPSYVLLNPSITWTSVGGRYALKLYARNLLDERYYLNRSEQAGLTDVQREAQPRTYGATLSAYF